MLLAEFLVGIAIGKHRQNRSRKGSKPKLLLHRLHVRLLLSCASVSSYQICMQTLRGGWDGAHWGESDRSRSTHPCNMT